MDIDWDDLRLFLSVARLGGLSAATAVTGLSAATLGRRITAFEKKIGKPLFVRSQTGYRLTEDGEGLLARAQDVDTAMLSVKQWREGTIGRRVVRLSAGAWTSAFVANHIDHIWTSNDHFGVELVTANHKVDIGRRHADLGIRNQRPSEQWLAGRLLGSVAYAIYAGVDARVSIDTGNFVGTSGDGGQARSARWIEARYGDRIVFRGNDPMSVRELVASGVGLSVFPCFVGDNDPRLMRVAEPIPELKTDQWLVSHHEERHDPMVRSVADRITALMDNYGRLFRGEVMQSLEPK